MHSIGGYLAVWQVRENQRKEGPIWNSVMDNSGHFRENIYFFTWSLIIASKKICYIFILSVTAKILVQV